MKEFKAVIDNKFIDNGKWVEIIDPVSLKGFAKVSSLTKEDIDLAYKSARNAQKNWELVPLLERIEVLKKFKAEMIKNQEIIINTLSQEVAKNLNSSKAEFFRTLEYIDYTFEEAKRLNPIAYTGEELGAKNKLGFFSRVAKGVVCAISPFNYPFNLSMAKIIPALVTGNSVVFKPATSGSALGCLIGKAWVDASLPKGVFNVVTGRGSEIGDEITSHREIDMISFTGSADIGQRLRNNASTTDLVLELGGKDPALVLDDSNLEKFATDIVGGAFSYSGQRCTAIKRVFALNEVADKLAPIITKKVNDLKVGLPKDNCDITHLITEKSASYVQSLIDDSIKKGAKILTGNKSEKNLLWPTLVDCVTPEMKLAWDEPFGPVLPIIRVKDIDEMIKLTNQSKFGLQACIFTSDVSKALNLAKQLEVGTVNINGKPERGPDSFPFIGIKNSGEGVQGIRESLLSMTRIKGTVINY